MAGFVGKISQSLKLLTEAYCINCCASVSELVAASVEPVAEDKARKVLERVDFLSRVREEVAALPDLAQRLDRLAVPALDLPEWWIPGRHDTDLVLGAAR